MPRAAIRRGKQNNIAIYKRVVPAVVNITSTAMSYDFFYGMVPQQGQGSGFILDKSGHILTNYHVIQDASRIEVTLSDKHKYKAQVVGADKPRDLALLEIDAPNLSPVILADSKELVVGQKVYAIGNPFGLNGTMTTWHHKCASGRFPVRKGRALKTRSRRMPRSIPATLAGHC